MKQLPSLEEINKVRRVGFRPTVVACLIYKKKVLLVFKKEFHHWLMPQGGVENQEGLIEALVREVKEEVGEKISGQIRLTEPYLLTEDEIDFKESEFSDRDLRDDNGTKIEMLGKHYYFLVVPISKAGFDARKSEFDRVIWANYQKAQKIIDTIYLQNKKNILQKSIDFLKQQGLIE